MKYIAMILIFSLFGTVDGKFKHVCYVDVVEYNTIYDVIFNPNGPPNSKYRLIESTKQTIGWKYDPDGEFHVDWFVIGHFEPLMKKGDCWVIIININTEPVLVYAKSIRYSHTLEDVEIMDRERYKMDWRAGLYSLNKILKQESDYKFKMVEGN